MVFSAINFNVSPDFRMRADADFIPWAIECYCF